ncbi:MAG: hypothetical protein DRN71_03795 [Candidatus Nanohalarchaeota archaeon]|nr:MAG: hypothetical protein DRN71_03795 [Candidatus Nanohaloarchaeota archaeon]
MHFLKLPGRNQNNTVGKFPILPSLPTSSANSFLRRTLFTHANNTQPQDRQDIPLQAENSYSILQNHTLGTKRPKDKQPIDIKNIVNNVSSILEPNQKIPKKKHTKHPKLKLKNR